MEDNLYLQVGPRLDHDERVGKKTRGELGQLWGNNAFQNEPKGGKLYTGSYTRTGRADNCTNLPNHLNLSTPSAISCSVGGRGQA